MDDTNVKNVNVPALWNPNTAANWCLIFTPAFGAYLHMLNWRNLGDAQREANSQRWFYAAIGLLALYPVFAVALPNSKAVGDITRSFAFIFLLTWYFGSARGQAKFVKERFGTNYTKRPWGKPLGIALLSLLGYIFVVLLIVAIFS